MISDRRLHTATLLNDGSILIAGGSHFDLNGNSPEVTLSSAEIFLPHSGPVQLKFSAQPVSGSQGAAIAPVVVELQDATGKPSFSSVSGDGHDALDDLFDLLGPGGQPGLDLNPV